MIENVIQAVEVFSLQDLEDSKPAIDAVMAGKITLLKVGSIFSIVYNPAVTALTEKICLLKERRKEQSMSVVCTYEQAKEFVDKNRVNKDFFRLSASFCSKVILRIPVDPMAALPFSYHMEEETVQFFSFETTHPLRSAFQKTLAARGCEYLSITSGNLSGAPTIEDLESAKLLAAVFNAKASFFGMEDTQTLVTDIPEDRGAHAGSFAILSFCNQNAIEVKRLVNKVDRELTEIHLKKTLAKVHTQTPLVYTV